MPGSNLANFTAARTAAGHANLELGLLDSLGEAVIATDLDGYIIYWNRSAETLYGWNAEEVLSRNILDVILTVNSRAAGAAIFERLTHGESWSGEFETRHKQGHGLLVHVTDYPVRDQHGRLTAIVGISKPLLETKAERSKPAAKFTHDLIQVGLAGLDFVYRRTLSKNASSPTRSFAVAVLLYGMALAMRVLLDQIIPGRLPFLSFFPAVVLSAFLCGLWPTIALLLASGITGAALSDAPQQEHHLRFQILSVTLFVLVGGLLIAPAIYSTHIVRRLKEKDEQVTLLNRELQHRIKNLFAVVSSIIGQTIRSGVPPDELAAAITGRIQALATAQAQIGITAEEGSDLLALVEAVVRPLAPDASRFDIDGPSVSLTSETTTPFALILYELATNAVKYGAWSSVKGDVSVWWRSISDKQIEFIWREKSVILEAAPAREGFGTKVITQALPQAKVDYHIGADGVVCHINLML
jgi:PAS domain S-box-containing protein